MEEDNSMSEKILNDIEHIMYNDRNLKEFSIVPIGENKNKSPVLYEEHNLGLESWCVKYVYRYLYKELFCMRHLLKKNRMPSHKVHSLNKMLIGALLLHPDVMTFWNMRRDLIQFGELSLSKELLLTKLVLSNRNKSTEAFAYRRWTLTKLLKNVGRQQVNYAIALLEEEFAVTDMAADRSPNNYHAWNHRIWCMENIASKNAILETSDYLNILLAQLDESHQWITRHVSEHTAFHYRQYLIKSILNNTTRSMPHDIKYHCFIAPYIGIRFSNGNNLSYLNNLLGRREPPVDELRTYNYVYYFLILLSDLLYFVESLNKAFPGHEAVWYHRRFIMFHLLKAAYDYHGLVWKHQSSNWNPNTISDYNIVSQEVWREQENGEKYPKVLKFESKVEASYLYKVIIDAEIKFLKENSAEKCSKIQKELASRHEKWLKLILRLNICQD